MMYCKNKETIDHFLNTGLFYPHKNDMYKILNENCVDIQWSNIKKGYFILNETLIRELLSCGMCEKRLSTSLQSIASKELREKAKHFFSTWPFYDDTFSQIEKEEFQRHVSRKIEDCKVAFEAEFSNREFHDLIKDTFRPAMVKMIMTIFDLDSNIHRELADASYLIIDFMQSDGSNHDTDELLKAISFIEKLSVNMSERWSLSPSLIANVIVDGVDPVVNLLINAILEYAGGIDKPEDEFIQSVLLNYPAFQYLVRYTKQETNVSGTHLPAGSKLYLSIGSANFRRTLETSTNTGRPLTFGSGLHACLGHQLSIVALKVVYKLFSKKKRLNINWESCEYSTHSGSAAIRSLMGTLYE